MTIHIKTFSDKSYIEFGKGKFDNWCIYLGSPAKAKYAPKDIDYFNSIIELGRIHGNGTFYMDFLEIYFATGKEIDKEILETISILSNKYKTDALLFDKVLSIVYAGMVAEENKSKAILKKRIKHLGIYQLLIEKRTAEYAANYSRGKTWQEINAICNERGIQ